MTPRAPTRPDPAPPPSKRLIVLGSTGSIGENTLRVADHLNRTGEARTEVVGLAAGANADRLIEQARSRRVPAIALADPAAAERARAALPEAQVFAGPDAARQLVERTDADMLVAAIVGAAGLPATLAAIRKGMDIALANKETLVAAGELVIPLVREHKVNLLPVDSEHSAIFQCLQTCLPDPAAASRNGKAVKRIVLTASGGPFRSTPLDRVREATVDQALNHPTWKMGPKITIDSATMMNKALEVIEAHWLFGLAPDQISVIIHPQSIAHSFVEFSDHSVLAQLGSPDMKTPIQYALTWPQRHTGSGQPMDWASLARLDFEPPDPHRFPALGLAYRAIEAGGTAGAVLNAANEEAVAAFLDRRIPFGRIVEINAAALDAADPRPADDIESILAADREARAFVRTRINR